MKSKRFDMSIVGQAIESVCDLIEEDWVLRNTAVLIVDRKWQWDAYYADDNALWQFAEQCITVTFTKNDHIIVRSVDDENTLSEQYVGSEGLRIWGDCNEKIIYISKGRQRLTEMKIDYEKAREVLVDIWNTYIAFCEFDSENKDE